MNWVHTAAWYVFGSLLGGLAVGTSFGSLGSVVGVADRIDGSHRLMILAGACLLGWLFDAGLIGRSVPTIKRQVNENWLPRYRGWVYGFGFGLQLGFALVTITRSSATYCALIAATLSGSVLGGLVIGVVFGCSRGLPILFAKGVTSPERLARLHRRLEGFDSAARLGAALAPLVVACGLTGILFL